MAPGKIDKWLDVQHRYMAIAQRALQRPALHAVAALAATAVTVATRRRRTRLTPRRGAVGAAGAASAGPAAAEGRDGREPVRPWRTRLRRGAHSRRSPKLSKSYCSCPDVGTS